MGAKISCPECKVEIKNLKAHQKTLKCQDIKIVNDLKSRNLMYFREQNNQQYMFNTIDDVKEKLPKIAEISEKWPLAVYTNKKTTTENVMYNRSHSLREPYYFPAYIYYIMIQGFFYWEREKNVVIWDEKICLDFLHQLEDSTELRLQSEAIYRLGGTEALYEFIKITNKDKK